MEEVLDAWSAFKISFYVTSLSATYFQFQFLLLIFYSMADQTWTEVTSDSLILN